MRREGVTRQLRRLVGCFGAASMVEAADMSTSDGLGGEARSLEVTRAAALLRLAEIHGVHRADQNTSGEDLGADLDNPERIKRWVSVTQSSETGIVYLGARYDTEQEAKEAAGRFIADCVWVELPVEVFDLDARRGISCELVPTWEGGE